MVRFHFAHTSASGLPDIIVEPRGSSSPPQAATWQVEEGSGEVYAESRWPYNPEAHMYLRSSAGGEAAAFAGGLALLVGSFAVVFFG